MAHKSLPTKFEEKIESIKDVFNAYNINGLIILNELFNKAYDLKLSLDEFKDILVEGYRIKFEHYHKLTKDYPALKKSYKSGETPREVMAAYVENFFNEFLKIKREENKCGYKKIFRTLDEARKGNRLLYSNIAIMLKENKQLQKAVKRLKLKNSI